MDKTDNPTDTKPESKKRQLGALELAQRQTAALRHGLNANPTNAASIRAKLGKRVRRLVRLERARRPWLGDDTDNLLRMLAERRIMKEDLLIECDRKGILGTSGNESRRSKAIDKIDAMMITIERALPARPDVRGGRCDLSAPDFRLPIQCLRRFRAEIDEPLPAATEQPEILSLDDIRALETRILQRMWPDAPTPEQRRALPGQQLIQEATEILEGGQS